MKTSRKVKGKLEPLALASVSDSMREMRTVAARPRRSGVGNKETVLLKSAVSITTPQTAAS